MQFCFRRDRAIQVFIQLIADSIQLLGLCLERSDLLSHCRHFFLLRVDLHLLLAKDLILQLDNVVCTPQITFHRFKVH